MASKITAHSLCANNSKEDDFGFGGVGGKGCCGKVRWNTVRQGEIWINGLFCEQEVYMSNGSYEAAGSQGTHDSWRNGHSEVDWITKEIAFQELICNEDPTNISDLQTGIRGEFGGEEHDLDIRSTFTAVAAWFGDWHAFEGERQDPLAAEGNVKPIKIKKDKGGDWALNDTIRSEASKNIEAFTVASAQNFSPQTIWSANEFAWDGFGKEYFQDQQALYHGFINQDTLQGETFRTSKENQESIWMPYTTVKNLDQVDVRACKGYVGTDLCLMGRSGGKEAVQQMCLGECDNGGVRREALGKEDEIERVCFLQSDSEKKEGGQLLVFSDNLDMGKGRAGYMEEKQPATCGYGLVSEGEIRATSSAVDELPHCMRRENRPAEIENDEGKQKELSLADVSCKEDGVSANKDGSSMPPEALFYTLSYVSFQDLLTMERVCKSLREFVRNDVLLWRRLHVEPPLSKKLTDEVLLQLASRSKGQLQCLSLVDCLRVTEGAVEQVLNTNPRISKLCIPGCSRISADAVVRMVKAHTDRKALGMPGLKQLRIRNIYGLTRDHLDSLQTMVGDGEQAHSGSGKPQFYHNGHYTFSCDDQRPIDVEACPKCANARLVYDCTRERCQQKQGSKLQECRGCIFCIARCEECGRCINDNDYEETFCLDLLCSSCWLRLPKCSECNRPGCGRHADHFIRTPETTFVCGDCCGSSPGASGPEFHVFA